MKRGCGKYRLVTAKHSRVTASVTSAGNYWLTVKTYNIPPHLLYLQYFSFISMPGKRIVVGYSDGSAKVFDLKTLDVLQHLNANNAHTNTISSIDCHRDNNLIVTGSLDSTAKLYHTQTGKVFANFYFSLLNC